MTSPRAKDVDAARKRAARAAARGEVIPEPDRSPFPDDAWRSDAACKGQPTRLWFSFEPGELAAGQRICRSCRVQENCLADAIERSEEHGMWGGVPEDELRQIRRRRTA